MEEGRAISDTIRYQARDRKAYLTLNRPDRLNAINDELAREIPWPWSGLTGTRVFT